MTHATRAWKHSERDNTTRGVRGFPVSRGPGQPRAANADESRRNSSLASTVKPCKSETEREGSLEPPSPNLSPLKLEAIAYLCVSIDDAYSIDTAKQSSLLLFVNIYIYVTYIALMRKREIRQLG